MSLLSRIRAAFGDAPDTEASPTGPVGAVESGLPEDAGGSPDQTGRDANSSTGTSPHETFVGRASGDDAGYIDTGAEQRREDD